MTKPAQPTTASGEIALDNIYVDTPESSGPNASSREASAREASAEEPSRKRPVGELTAAEVMSTPVVTISVRDTLWDAWGLLFRSGLRHLVVVDGDRCVGVIDDRRIALEWPLGPSRDLVRRVGEIIGSRPRCVLADTSVRDLARTMLRDRIDVLPVVTSRGDLVGLVTATDLLSVLAAGD